MCLKTVRERLSKEKNSGEWRLTNQENYLKGVTLIRDTFKEKNDHAHCEFCWVTFVCGTEGYTTEDRKHWICDTCYKDFCERFKWRTVE